MATPISNIVTPAQSALNGKLYGGGANAFGQQTPAPQSSFDAGASKLFGDIGGAIQGGVNALANTKFGQQPQQGVFPVSPALQASANNAQGAGNSVSSTGGSSAGVASNVVNPTIGTGATLNGQPVSGAPGGPINGGTIGQVNSQPNLPVTPQNPAAQVFNPQTGTWGPATPQAPFSAAATGLLNAPAQNTQLGQNATNITDSYNKQIAALAPLTSAAGDLSTGTAAVGGGNATLDSNAISQRIQALEGQEAQQLSGNTQGIAAQGQAQSALSSAGQLTQPQLAGIGTQQYYNPLEAGTSGNNSQYGTGPAAASNVASIQSQTSTINDLAASRAAASSIVSNQLTPFLQQNGINPSDFNAVNQFLQNIGAQTSSPQYATFKNMVADLASVYAQILTPPGGSTTDLQTQIAQSLINSTSSGQSILQVIQNLDGQAQSKIAGLQTNVSNLQNDQNVNTAASSGGSSGGSLYDF